MALRTTKSAVVFAAPFTLKAVNGEILPAGNYEVETDEEVIEGNERTIYRRVATLLFVRSGGTTRTVTVEPLDLAQALANDRSSKVE
jgi:hypothetical protein